MAELSQTDAATLCTIIADNEAWLVDRILFYARRQGYTVYTSNLRENWRRSITGLSASLLTALGKALPDVELNPDEDYTADPLAQFGILEANHHRSRGIALGMFLGLMKYYRQSYTDLVNEASPDSASRQRFSLMLKRLFDRIEIGLITTWHAPQQEAKQIERQRANRTITNEKNTYLTIFESLRSPVAVLNRDNRIETVNPAWKELFGGVAETGANVDAESQRNRPIRWLATEIDRFVTGEMDEDILEKRVETAHGGRHLAIRIKRMFDVSERFSGCLLILDDVTRQKETESALQETTIWLTEMFNALEEAVFIGTPGGLIVNANKAAQKIFGYSAAELKNQTTELLHVDNDHFEAFTARVREALAVDDNTALESMARRKNGDVFPAMVTIRLLKKKDDTPLGIVSILRDISALKMAEAATRNSERLQGALELAGAVCHDLNQPLMAITGYAELILMDCPEEAIHFPKLKKIVDQVAKLGDITKKLMHVTRYETKTYGDQQIIDIEKASGGS